MISFTFTFVFGVTYFSFILIIREPVHVVRPFFMFLVAMASLVPMAPMSRLLLGGKEVGMMMVVVLFLIR